MSSIIAPEGKRVLQMVALDSIHGTGVHYDKFTAGVAAIVYIPELQMVEIKYKEVNKLTHINLNSLAQYTLVFKVQGKKDETSISEVKGPGAPEESSEPTVAEVPPTIN